MTLIQTVTLTLCFFNMYFFYLMYKTRTKTNIQFYYILSFVLTFGATLYAAIAIHKIYGTKVVLPTSLELVILAVIAGIHIAACMCITDTSRKAIWLYCSAVVFSSNLILIYKIITNEIYS